MIDRDSSGERAALATRVHDLARRQHGLVTRTQLLEAGATSSWVQGRVRRRRLVIVHRGVYRVGPLSGPRAREMAALLASGPEAVVCGRSAAAIHGLTPPQKAREPVHVYVGATARGRRPGVKPHRTTTLMPDEVTAVQRLRITTPARTVIDLAADSPLGELQRALARGSRRKLFDRSELLELIRRHRHRRGVAELRKLLHQGADAEFARSKAEESFLALVRKGDLPKPEVNVMVEGYEVDFFWRRRRVVVEVDGFAFHSSREAFEEDRRRDIDLSAAGFRVLRITWRQLTNKPEAFLVRLGMAFAHSLRADP